MSIEAMKMALEALETHVPHVYKDRGYEPITTLRQAIERAAKQDPVAWGIANTRPTEKNPLMSVQLYEPEPSHLVVPLYTAPSKREWVGLTDEEIDDLWKTEYFNIHYELPRDVEAKLKEKNRE